MVRPARGFRVAAAVILLLAASTSVAAERSPAVSPPRPGENTRNQDGKARPPRADRKGTEARLDAVNIVGRADRPAILFFLPRSKFRLLPMRPEPDAGRRLLRDDKLSGVSPGS